VGAITVGHILPLLILIFAWPGGSTSLGPAAVAGLLAVIGLYMFEHAFIMAPPEVPNS
jgi:hypothetical protein